MYDEVAYLKILFNITDEKFVGFVNSFPDAMGRIDITTEMIKTNNYTKEDLENARRVTKDNLDKFGTKVFVTSEIIAIKVRNGLYVLHIPTNSNPGIIKEISQKYKEHLIYPFNFNHHFHYNLSVNLDRWTPTEIFEWCKEHLENLDGSYSEMLWFPSLALFTHLHTLDNYKPIDDKITIHFSDEKMAFRFKMKFG